MYQTIWGLTWVSKVEHLIYPVVVWIFSGILEEYLYTYLCVLLRIQDSSVILAK